jgi:hypothetical protein
MESTIVSWLVTEGHNGTTETPVVKDFDENDIASMPRPMPEGMFDPMPEVIATFEDDSTKSLFSFFPDEVSFRPSEFVGLTEEEAHSLFQGKDTAYLRA